MHMLVCDCICMYLQAQTSAEIHAVAKMKLKATVLDDELNYVTKEIPYVSPEVRAMPDNMLVLSAYGRKTMFESDRTLQAFRTVFAEYYLQAAIDNEDAFYSSWKEYRKQNPVQRKTMDPVAVATGSVNLDAMMGDANDDVLLFAGAGGAPAPAAPDAAAAVNGNKSPPGVPTSPPSHHPPHIFIYNIIIYRYRQTFPGDGTQILFKGLITLTHTLTHRNTHTCIHTYIHRYLLTYIHTHIHTHTC